MDYKTGLFKAIPFDKRDDLVEPSLEERYGITHTRYSDAMEILLDNGITLFDMFHGKCELFLSYFLLVNPKWSGMILKKGSRRIHAFAMKSDGKKILFADARGITDNIDEFLDDFETKNTHIESFDISTDLVMQEKALCEKAYGYCERR